jgi:hypothetical protein
MSYPRDTQQTIAGTSGDLSSAQETSPPANAPETPLLPDELSTSASRSDYIIQWIEGFTKGDSRDTTLWYNFQECFEGWDASAFNSITPGLAVKLRDGLRQNGVYVKRGRGYAAARQLAVTVEEETMAE